MANCNVCKKKVLPHSYHVRCSNCRCFVHINCLPYVKKDDAIFKERESNVWFCTVCTADIFPFNHLDDSEEFILALSESWHTDEITRFENLTLQEKLFTPFDLNVEDSSPLSEVDPDLQFYLNQCSSSQQQGDYYLEDTFNKKISHLDKNSMCVSMIHLNIRSATKNLDKFETFLANLDHKFPIIALSETWLKSHNENLCNIQNYQSEHNIRHNKGGGGVSIFIQNDIEYVLRKDLTIQNNIMEALFIEIPMGKIGNKCNIIVGVIYRAPDTNMTSFNELLAETLLKIKSEKKDSYLLGDYNVNLLSLDKHGPTQDFADLMYSNSLFPSITKPTRVTNRSATLIDNIFCNRLIDNPNVLSGILYTDISDHFPVFFIDYKNTVYKKPMFFKKRIFSQENMTSFSTTVNEHNWDHILNNNDPQDAYTDFFNDYSELYNSSFPVKTFKHGYRNRKPWLTKEIKNCIKMKNKMYRNTKKSKNPDLEVVYKRFRNKVNKMMFKAEKDHYDKLICNSKNNLKKSWRILKDIINKKQQSGSKSRFLVNNRIVTDSKEICNGFNDFFVNVGTTLAKKIPNVNKNPTSFMTERILDSMFIEDVVEKEVTEIIQDLKEGSVGWDDISAKVVKSTFGSCISPLVHVFNLSLKKGVFPSELKIAKVIPLYKSGDTMTFSNYRPVSVLPLFYKIFERLMYNRLLSFNR